MANKGYTSPVANPIAKAEESFNTLLDNGESIAGLLV
jgi:hypothetical protein